jgi:hypothetical protein
LVSYQEGVKCRYRFAAVKMGLKAMSAANKVSVRIDGESVLSMNFMVDIEGKNCFVEFRVRVSARGGGNGRLFLMLRRVIRRMSDL